MTRRVILTGASGFVGRQLAPKLVATGWEVHLLGRTPGHQRGTVFHEIDLLNSDPKELLSDIGAQAAVHLAWCSEPGQFWNDPANLDWVAASLRLTRGFATAGGKRLVVAGSCAEYDWAADRFDEQTTPLRPSTLYGQAKASLFEILMKASKILDLSVAWGRIFFPYGPTERHERLVGSIMDGIIAGTPIDLSNGEQRRDFIHIDDVGRAFAMLLDSDVCGAFNIASGKAVSVKTLAQTLVRPSSSEHLLRFGNKSLQPGEPPLIEAAIDRLEQIGFHPEFDIETGLKYALAQRRRHGRYEEGKNADFN